MEKTNKPTIAGILNIIAGALGIIGAISMFIGFYIVSGCWGIPGMEAIPRFVPGIILAIAIPSLIVSILALVGGVFCVQRKQWSWALAGSIAAILAFLPLGIVSTVLAAQSKNEFE